MVAVLGFYESRKKGGIKPKTTVPQPPVLAAKVTLVKATRVVQTSGKETADYAEHIMENLNASESTYSKTTSLSNAKNPENQGDSIDS